MDDENKVIQFPKERQVPQCEEDVAELLDDFREIHIDDAIEELAPHLFRMMNNLGFDQFAEKDLMADKLTMFLLEAVKAYMTYHHGLPHPFHELADKMIEADKANSDMLEMKEMTIIKKDEAKK